ncbi:uncharacterized protein [Ptychodera flava]|uniref:uncharacterized protein n=1 Tax=Ptychodera flava TaxID=63121 RepID=UPI00396A2531
MAPPAVAAQRFVLYDDADNKCLIALLCIYHKGNVFISLLCTLSFPKNVSSSVRFGKDISSLSETAQNFYFTIGNSRYNNITVNICRKYWLIFRILKEECFAISKSRQGDLITFGNGTEHYFTIRNIHYNNITVNRCCEYWLIFRISKLTKVSSRRFLVSVHYDINGPNVHYEAFRAGLAYAVQEKRTIVESFFYTHWTQGHNKTKLKRLFNETFDLSKLSQIVEYSTVAEFNRECNNTIELLLVDSAVTVDWDLYLDRAKKYLEIYNIKLPAFVDLVASQGKVLPSHRTSPSVKCLGVYEPSFWKSLLTPKRVLSNGTIDRHLLYAEPIRRLGKTIASIMCNGNDYMALHFALWRNMTGEVCGRTICSGEKVEVVAAINKTAIMAAKDIKVFIQENNLSCIYVALRPFARKMLQFLRTACVPNVVDVDDLKSEKYHEAREVINDNYIFSLVEQEICIGNDF